MTGVLESRKMYCIGDAKEEETYMLKRIDVQDLDGAMLDPYVRLKENQLYHYFEPAPGLFLAESPKVIGRALSAGYVPYSFLVQPDQLHGEAAAVLEQCAGRPEDIPLYVAEEEVLRRITGYGMTRGVLCAMRRRPEPASEEMKKLCSAARHIAVLENIVNPTNVGAIFRNAAALGADAVLLTGGCADPLSRRAIRVSMGTVFQVPWIVCHEEKDVLPMLKSAGFITMAMALHKDDALISDASLKNGTRSALFLGSEGEGLKEETILACDHVVRIPMEHGVDSLNVAAASAVAFWELWKDACHSGS